MEIKKETVLNELKYPEKTSINCNKLCKPIKRTSLFSAMLFSMISSNTIYGFETNFNELPPTYGGIEVQPYHNPIGHIIGAAQIITLIISLISLITTIIYGVKMYKLKKNKEAIMDDENNESTSKESKKDKRKRIKKGLIVSGVVFLISSIVYTVCAYCLQ